MSTNISQILGKKLAKVEVVKEDNEIFFTLADGTRYRMGHMRRCCETVSIVDISGDLDDLENAWVLIAEEACSGDIKTDGFYTYSWTFYKFATIKGYVTICWRGRSNGFYSVDVDFVEVGSDSDWKQWEEN